MLKKGLDFYRNTVFSCLSFQITAAAEKASKAYKEVKVHHKEDLVVPFGVP